MSIQVFLADDHAVVRDGLLWILEAETDITVVGDAGNGRKAIREVRSLRPDVVVMDISMPKLNGIEATRQICESFPGTQVVILSMHTATEHIYRALTAGARGYVLKESAGKEVVDAVRAVHAGRRFLSEKIADTVLDDYIRRGRTSDDKNPLDDLSSREREILQLVVEGKSSAQIAKSIHLSPKTVETYRSRMMQKLDIHDLPNLVKFAIKNRLTSLG